MSICPAHTMIEDQRLLDGLAFGRYIAKRLVEQEFCLSGSEEEPDPVL